MVIREKTTADKQSLFIRRTDMHTAFVIVFFEGHTSVKLRYADI